jgi:hypothetical protein
MTVEVRVITTPLANARAKDAGPDAANFQLAVYNSSERESQDRQQKSLGSLAEEGSEFRNRGSNSKFIHPRGKQFNTGLFVDALENVLSSSTGKLSLEQTFRCCLQCAQSTLLTGLSTTFRKCQGSFGELGA